MEQDYCKVRMMEGNVMTVKEALTVRFNYMMQYYAKTKEGYPQIPWNSNVDSKIYVGNKKESGWISWKPIEKDIKEDFLEIEKELGVQIHEDIKEYYNSFWFLSLTVPINGHNYIMKNVAPGREFFGLLRQWKECKNYFKDDLYLILGQESNGGYDLMINNNNGKIYSFSHSKNKLELLADNLADFLLTPLKKR